MCMEESPRIKMALERLCEFAELHYSVSNDQDRFNVDERAYEYLAFSGFYGEEMKRLVNNYVKMKEERIH